MVVNTGSFLVNLDDLIFVGLIDGEWQMILHHTQDKSLTITLDAMQVTHLKDAIKAAYKSHDREEWEEQE